ncbi:MAG: hypothetical protein ACK55I_48590, partial [bacterium]
HRCRDAACAGGGSRQHRRAAGCGDTLPAPAAGIQLLQWIVAQAPAVAAERIRAASGRADAAVPAGGGTAGRPSRRSTAPAARRFHG